MFRGENIKPTAADVGLIHEARLILDAETVERDRSIFRGEGRRIAARVEGAGGAAGSRRALIVRGRF